MSVLVQYATMVVRVETLEAKYPGGLQAFEREHIDWLTGWHDGLLAVVTDMNGRYLEAFVRSQLESRGLRVFDDEKQVYDEVVFIGHPTGPRHPCAWLEFCRHPDGYSFCWVKGYDPGALVGPRSGGPNALQRASMNVPEGGSHVEKTASPMPSSETSVNEIMELLLNDEVGSDERADISRSTKSREAHGRDGAD